MMEERDNYWDDELIEAVNRFKRSLISGRTKYFDVSEFEGIVELLLDEGDIQSSEIAAEQGIKIHPNAVPLQLKYAQILINKGLYEKSLSYLKAAEKLIPTIRMFIF
jgi:tetratricopeptide (TPR) repeat protein